MAKRKEPKGPALYDWESYFQLGIDPKTGYPIKFNAGTLSGTKENIAMQLRVADQKLSLNRFTWYNLPYGLDANTIERIIYWRGQGTFFRLEQGGLYKYYFLPFSNTDELDILGRYGKIRPLSFNGTLKDDNYFLPQKQLHVVYDVQLPEFFIDENGEIETEKIKSFIKDAGVIMRDYSSGLNQTVTPMSVLQEGIINIESMCIPLMRTALIVGSGVRGLKGDNQNDKEQIDSANDSFVAYAEDGKPFVPMYSLAEFQDFANGAVSKAEEYLLAMQAIDNFRIAQYGAKNGGLFQKKAHVLESEESVNDGNTGFILRDSLESRQRACLIANSIWGTNMWCEPSEVALGIDTTGDGIIGDNESQNTNIGQGGQEDDLSDNTVQ